MNPKKIDPFTLFAILLTRDMMRRVRVTEDMKVELDKSPILEALEKTVSGKKETNKEPVQGSQGREDESN